MTLREVCENAGVSRRAVQGYEQAGLITPIGKNKRGYLLYSQEEQEKIKQIKFSQEMGFSIKEIKKMSSAPREDVKKAIEQKIEALWLEIERKESIIERAELLLKQL